MTPKKPALSKSQRRRRRRVTAEQAFLRDAVRDPHWAGRGVLGLYVRRLAAQR
jgi:hypothetical protein